MKLLLAFDNAHDIYLGCERNSAASEENKNIRLNSFFLLDLLVHAPAVCFFSPRRWRSPQFIPQTSQLNSVIFFSQKTKTKKKNFEFKVAISVTQTLQLFSPALTDTFSRNRNVVQCCSIRNNFILFLGFWN